VLQFLTHGLYDPMRSRPAALLLSPGRADDGRLFGDAIEAELPAPELVILSACGAARGPARLGDDGVTSLGGAFLSAGARCVILSRYDLELEATLLLTRHLFARLDGGDSPAEALRAARAELSADPRFAHPFFHAGVQAVGLGGGTILPPR
jgi:CHAT domain-containing protein